MSDHEMNFIPDPEEDNFVIISHQIIRNRQLSWAAKGLLSYLLSHTKAWKIKVKQLSSFYEGDRPNGNGRDAILQLIKELQKNRYIVYKKSHDKSGRWVHQYYLFKTPRTDEQIKLILPETEVPALEVPYTEVPVIQEDHREEYHIKEKQQPQTPSKKQDVVVVFSSLKDRTDLSDQDKQSLMSYPEERVDKAIEYCTHVEFKLKTSLIQALHWHCKLATPLAYSVPNCDKDKFFKSLKKYDGKKLGWANISLGRDYIEFSSGQSVKFFDLKDKDFIVKVNDILQKLAK